MILTLPWPVSANKRLIPARGRWVLNPRYREWKDTAAVVLAIQLRGLRMVDPPYHIKVWVHPPDKRRRDLDNFTKAALDALTAAHAITDDSAIDWLEVRRGERCEGGCLKVEILSL
jgi:crossover junction endodeoxyribonuclease RusA